MKIVSDLDALRAQVAAWRSASETVAFAPTMGALHEGHLSLVELGKAHASRAVASVFVNPTQFAPHEDFDAYPRDLDRDAALLAGAGCDLLYAPDRHAMYPDNFATSVNVAGVSAPMEGAMRPTHFAGVAVVVCKLLNRVQPDIAVFGEKDYQQLQVIRRMVADLDMNVQILGAPIKRDHDGLALSSRNAYLNAQERVVAGRFNVILAEAVNALRRKTPIASALDEAKAKLLEVGFKAVDYVELVDPDSLMTIAGDILSQPARLIAVARIGNVRLLDNMAV